ncbi:hypothetical protein B484DRAFT_445331 [Ochromonadaceae sp. CCMP2298]|nr:hypothetical protein B484DRAFT_445331 [Ochromonadaceae sp. CCMP2298]|mmetsp:Transcript_218/g.441  ORF Transcript_218/g.441 Transcript_218/m.441 type:complete len:231 (+) Transcript_218:151-843(+)|eukprot:CAMPEP_0173173812 /NCGR_PEP_ID=MMETSP1141-20130122/3026_1 /TAXON_ID=483371 /ORGANISM="non described non described, Strain CCMP2298" /LENGTH=230 /DNA_ID=CAMNT_0014095909 /DNA_START=75 /DNA_END=767 /DNA_ORIENTATION=+
MLLHCTILLGLLACAHTFVLSGGRFGRQGVLRSQNAGNVEEDLFGLEGGVEVVKEEKAQPKGSGVGKLFEDAIVMLGKVPKSKVRAMIVENGAEPPFPMEESLEMHINTAIDVIWNAKGGDWETFSLYMRGELKGAAEEATAHMRAAAMSAADMSESRIKELLRAYGGPNAVPKLRARRGTGTVTGQLEKGDYLAALIDLLREQNGNDYGLVAEMLAKESAATKKKGFGV